MFKKFKVMYDDTAAGGDTSVATFATFEDYLASLPAEQKSVVESLYTAKNQKLLDSVKATRDERDTLARDLRDAAKKAEKGSAAETELLDKAEKLDEANRRADFYETASVQNCSNPKVAYAYAKANNLFDKKTGLPDWKSIKEEAPQLFNAVASKPKGKGSAGEGTDKEPKATTVNDFIRKQAGIASE